MHAWPLHDCSAGATVSGRRNPCCHGAVEGFFPAAKHQEALAGFKSQPWGFAHGNLAHIVAQATSDSQPRGSVCNAWAAISHASNGSSTSLTLRSELLDRKLSTTNNTKGRKSRDGTRSTNTLVVVVLDNERRGLFIC